MSAEKTKLDEANNQPDKKPDSQGGYEAPEEMIFGENLEEFAVRVGHLVGLEHNGKLPTEEAYQMIKGLWRELKSTRKSLGLKNQGGNGSCEDSSK